MNGPPDSPGPPTFRAFVAVVPPKDVRAQLGAVVGELRQRDRDDSVRWVAADAMHITLAFLGQIEENEATQLIDALRAGVAGIKSFELGVGSLGTFGDRRRRGGAQVVWAGLDGNVDALRGLHEQVIKAVRSVGLRVESREFQPHITLGRVRRGRRWRLEAVDSPAIPTAAFRVDAVTLMESRLGRGPAVYVERGKVALE